MALAKQEAKEMKRIIRAVLLGALVVVVATIPVLSAYYAYITVTESTGTDYENLALNYSYNISYLVENGYITSTGLDTRITNSDYLVLPHMLAEDRFLWVTDLEGDTSTQFIFFTGQLALDSFPTITGHGGYVTIADTADLEPGDTFAFGVVGYVNMTAGVNKTIIRKDGACSLNVTATGNLTFSVSGGNNMTATSVTSDYHTIMVYCNSSTMWMDIDDVEAVNGTASVVPDTANDWYLFEGNVMPYVAYYGEWVVP